MLPDQQQRILGYFIEEARDHLNTIEQGLLNLESTLNDPEMVNEVFRAAHSIKGGAAMLGLSSIQHTAHRLEDCFKVLKEHPVKIDQKLESLFLGVSDTLKALLEHLSKPFGLTEEAANTLMSEAEPVFQWLNQHLELLVHSNGAIKQHANTADGTSTLTEIFLPREISPLPEAVQHKSLENSSLALQATDDWSEFQTQVLQTLREMLQLFKQPATSASRQNLQQCCQQLARLGDRFNLPNWCSLLQAAADAIANSENTYLTLAKIVITEIKQAQELVIQNRETEIVISQQLQGLLSFPEIELLEITPNLTVEQSAIVTETSTTTELIPSTNNFAIDNTEQLLQLAPSTSNVDSLSEPIEQFNLDANTSENLSLDLHPTSDIPFSSLPDQEIEIAPRNNSIDPHGPEVGIAELNTLADLFEGETPDLDETWQQEEILDIIAVEESDIDANSNETEDTESDLSDLLLVDEKIIHQQRPTTTKTTEDLSLLFGDNFLEKDHLEPQPISTTSLNLNDINSSENTQEISDIYNDLQLSSVEDGQNDFHNSNVAEDLLDLSLNDHESLPTGAETIASIELSTNQPNSITENADLTESTADSDYIQPQNIPLQPQAFSLDNLLSDLEEQTPLTNESEIGELLDTLSASTSELSFSENELSNLWNQETIASQQYEFDEENLFAVSADDVLADSQQPILNPVVDFDLEYLDITFPEQEQPLDLIFSSDIEDDLFSEVAPSNPTTESIIDNSEISPQEISSLSQQPEALEFIPEFTNQLPEISAEDSLQTFAELEIDLFDTVDEELPLQLFEDIVIHPETTDNSIDDLLAIELTSDSTPQTQSSNFLDAYDNINENLPPQLFEDIATENSIDMQSEVTELSITELDSALPILNLEIADIAENNPTETAFDFTETDSAEPSLIDDLLFTETSLPAANQEELLENTVNSDLTETIAQEDITAFDLKLDENLAMDLSEQVEDLPQADEAATEELGTTPTAVTSEDETPPQDEFADLEALLRAEEVAPVSGSISTPEVDFAALEALLVTDNNQALTTPQNQPVLLSPHNTANIAVSLSGAGDEFGDLEKLLAEADQTISHSSLAKQNTNKTPRSSTRRAAKFEETMKVPVKQLDDMSNLVGELVVNRNTLEQNHERLRQFLDNLLIQVQQLSDVGARMQELYERSLLEASLLAGRKTQDSSAKSYDSDTDRGFSELEMDRFTPFHTLSQQMIERIVRVRESASDIDFVTEETERVARQFRQVTTQLQEGLTRARMVPFAQTIDRLRRGVRDNAIKCGKQVELVIEGGDTLIDKMILDHLTDPLTHMLNNAIAHGIETPEERQAAGKAPVGIITIRAFHQGNQTVISVGDDGAGIDPERIKAKAVKIGTITPAQAKTMSRLEVYDLLFQSGFTIKDQADEMSGRGVGMDVVRSEISEIRGTVNTDSAIGKGTTFTIRLPLTLSICKALCCVSDRARIAFPMDGVEDTLDIPVKNIQQDANGQSFISWRDTQLPFRPLKELLTFNRQLSRGNVYGGNRDDDMVSVVVVRSGNTLIALQIDQVLSEQEIVIKQFEGPAPKPIGVAGATVLGDGRIMPIADVLEIIDIFQGRISNQAGGTWQHKGVPDTSAVKIDPTVLIVDDSITVRELLSLTFNKAGYRVEQARDGQEAWDKLRSGLPCDIVFCDIEMPRCDGLELLSRIQKDSNLNHLPIAMLTSRGADKHRQMAVQLGASGYFTKPYLEEALLEAAGRMLKGEKLVNSTTNT
ncbi:MAG: response regulator [Desmonostoc vinosum HA7617-LM4]|jgi:chemosensory pili system protein ChpA (sensor histidine kinase/response regulator)|nr:response regulator [Desmonostoc vinosum HA7617-LM4]